MIGGVANLISAAISADLGRQVSSSFSRNRLYPNANVELQVVDVTTLCSGGPSG